MVVNHGQYKYEMGQLLGTEIFYEWMMTMKEVKKL